MKNKTPLRKKISYQTIKQLVDNLRRGDLKAEDILKYHLSQIKHNASLNAFITVFETQSIAKARNIDHRVEKGEKTGDLRGLVVAVKDNINIANELTTCASKALTNYRSPYNATVIERLIAKDAVLIGKTNMDEFGMGSSNENSFFSACRNPYDPVCVPGGSSGGSAVAVAADMAQVSLGSDTGGSIRQPAAFTGLVGLKPSYGRVSRYGLVAYASSLDQIGILSKSVADTAYVFKIIAGYDVKDATSARVEVPDYEKYLNRNVADLRIGVPKEYFREGLDSEIKDRIYFIIGRLKSVGAKIVNLSLPHSEYGIAAYYIIATAEASSNLARYDGIKYGFRNRAAHDLVDSYKSTRAEGFGDEVKRRIMLGTYVLSSGYYEAYYRKAQQVRRLIKEDYDKVFKDVDCILTPTTPTTAFAIGEKTQDPLAMYLSDIYTVNANLAGIAAINIPVGKDSSGLPIGLQIMSPAFREENLFWLGDYIEREGIE